MENVFSVSFPKMGADLGPSLRSMATWFWGVGGSLLGIPLPVLTVVVALLELGAELAESGHDVEALITRFRAATKDLKEVEAHWARLLEQKG